MATSEGGTLKNVHRMSQDIDRYWTKIFKLFQFTHFISYKTTLKKIILKLIIESENCENKQTKHKTELH